MSEREELVHYSWPIENAPQRLKDKISLRSSKFSNSKNCKIEWCLILTNITQANKNYTSVYIQSINHDYIFCSPILRVTFSMIYFSQGKILSRIKTIFDLKKKQLYGFDEFINPDKLMFDDFTIECKIQEVKEDFKNSKLLLNHYNSIDLCIMLNKQKYMGHQIVLAASSLHFRKMFGRRRKTFDVIEIKDMNYDICCALIKYMYKGEVSLLKEGDQEILSLFEASAKYKIFNLMRIYKEVLVTNLKVENVISTLLVCKIKFESDEYLRVYNEIIEELIHQCIDFIKNNFEVIMKRNLCKKLLDEEPRFLIDVLIAVFKYLKSPNDAKKDLIKKKEHVCLPTRHKEFERFINNESFSDIEIHVEHQKYLAHKVLLAGKSPVFDRMLSHTMKETITGVIEIEDLKPEVFQEVLHFLYTNELMPKDNLVQEILIAADRYEIDDLIRRCEDFLIEKLTVENVISLLQFSDDHNAARLMKVCFDFITDLGSPYFSDVSAGEFKDNSLTDLAISHSYLLYKMLEQV